MGELKVAKTARYALSGPLDGNYKSICFVLHGYGQLVTYFIRKFQIPELKDVLFIAPEGLHRFYLNGSKGRVGASWMTKEERLTDIEDYCLYLDSLYNYFREVIDKTGSAGALGFSQGVATACRWLATSEYKFNYLISWAGAFPPDLDVEKALQKLQNIPLWMTAGTEDEFISEEDFTQHIDKVKGMGFSPEHFRFEGKHTIYKEPLLKIFRKILPGN